MMNLQLSPLYPLKGRITTNLLHAILTTNTPLRGQGVNTLLTNFQKLLT